MNRNSIGIPFLFVLFFLSAVNSQAQNIEEQIKTLENDFNQFRYQNVIEKGSFLLADRYTTKEDSIKILKLMLKATYTLDDTLKARSVVDKILSIDANFSFNPKITSPKIIAFYETLKKDIRRQSQQIRNTREHRLPVHLTDTLGHVEPEEAVLSVLYPGSAQLLRQKMKKGIIYSSVTAGLMASTIFAYLDTNNKREAYMEARDGSDYSELYRSYNRSFKIRNGLITAFLIWNVYVQFDLHRDPPFHINISNNHNALSVRFYARW